MECDYNFFMMKRKTPLVIGIAGGSGSGKTTVANEILKVINNHYSARLPLLNPNNFPGISIVPSN